MQKEENKTEVILVDDEQTWIDKINLEATQKAAELSEILNCVVEPAIFVIEENIDYAIAYLRKPDAKQSFKIIRIMGEDYDTGLEMAAKSQLIREYDGKQVSDPRFMDVNGVYAPQYSELNLSLLMRVQGMIKFFKDQFKKK